MPAKNPDAALTGVLDKDRIYLEQTQLPVVTVSATFREDLKGFHGWPEDETIPDVVFSRAHYSMAVAVAMTQWKSRVDPQKCWVVDPTNYVKHGDWQRIVFTEQVGKTLARHPLLKVVKDFIDKFGRSKLPILKSITPPLITLTKGVKRPVVSMHIAAGAILARRGKTVIQVVTDPHVREEYLEEAQRENITFCVFDTKTKTEFLEKAAVFGKTVPPQRVIVTGPPVDPRVVAARQKKTAWRSGPLQLCLTTGGLGTNKPEIESILDQLLPELRRRQPWLRLLLYAGTQADIAEVAQRLALKHRVALSPLDDPQAKFRLIYHPQIVDANELLISYGFPWAHGFITKPSGDMAYDAAAAGSFILTLKEWGVWEHNIRQVFEQLEISRPVILEDIANQLRFLTSSKKKSQSWVEQAMNHAFELEPLFLKGAEHIVEVAKALH